MARYNKKEITFFIDEKTGCHICTSHTISVYGYPQIKRNYRQQNMHHYLWEQKYSIVPKGMLICHKCDNRLCINIEHLFLGTIADNNDDKVKKDRQFKPKGEINSNNKLTEEQVLQIRQEKGFQKDIGKKYNITQSQVSEIKSKKSWSWL